MLRARELVAALRLSPVHRLPLDVSYDAALKWLSVHRQPGRGVNVSDIDCEPYPEVTGYIVPTLLNCGEEGRELAIDLNRWLMSIQQDDGGFLGADGRKEPYLFDTAQVMRGLLAISDLVPAAELALRRAADWMVATADDHGVIRPASNSPWTRWYGDHISEDIHLYALQPLLDAGRRFGENRYIGAVQQSIDYYVSKRDLLRFRMLTHFYGYILEALVDLGLRDAALQGLQDILRSQDPSGAIPAVPGAKWFCAPGSAQLAIVGYKLGLFEFADRTLNFLQLHQMPSGGFLGSYGPDAAYSPTAELSWAVKYFLDACHWRTKCRSSSADELVLVGGAPAGRTHSTTGLLNPVDTQTDAHSVPSVPRPLSANQRRALAQVLVHRGFEMYDRGNIIGARQALVQAVLRDVHRLTDRNVLSVFVRTLFPRRFRKAIQLLRRRL